MVRVVTIVQADARAGLDYLPVAELLLEQVERAQSGPLLVEADHKAVEDNRLVTMLSL